MSREEDDFRPVSLDFQKAGGSIEGWVPGYCVIHNSWIENAAGVETNQIEVGAQFHVKVDYTATNEQGSLLDPWKTCVTVKGDGIANYEDTIVRGTTISHHIATLGNMGNNIMPPGTGYLVLYIKLWIRDLVTDPYPPANLW